MKINQLSVFLENNNGELAEITRLLAENKINLRAISIAETESYGVLRLIADDYQRAEHVLKENGWILSITPVFAVCVPDRPSGLNELLEALSKEGVGVMYMYSLLSRASGEAYMIFRTDDEERLEEAVSKMGLRLAEPKDLEIK